MSTIDQRIKIIRDYSKNLSYSVAKRKKATELEKELIRLKKYEETYRKQLDIVNQLYSALT